jgi:hypothetical protein
MSIFYLPPFPFVFIDEYDSLGHLLRFTQSRGKIPFLPTDGVHHNRAAAIFPEFPTPVYRRETGSFPRLFAKKGLGEFLALEEFGPGPGQTAETR